MFQKILMIILIIAVILFGGFYAYNELVPKQDVASENVINYSTVAVEKGDIEVGVEVSGRLRGSYGGDIRVPGDYGTPISYIYEKIFIEEGKPVKKGDIVAKLKSPDLDSKLKTSREQLKDKQEELAEMIGVSVSELGSVNPAKGITIKAPIDGRIIMLEAEDGDELKQGNSVAKIVDDAKYIVRAKATTTELAMLKEGQEVALSISNFEGTNKAVIKEINKNAVPDVDKDGNSKGFIYWVTIEGKNPGLVQPGMPVSVGIHKGASVFYLLNQTTVEGFGEEQRVLNRAEGIVTQVFVHNMDVVKKGDNIVSMAGADMQKSIQNKLEEIKNLKREVEDYVAKYDTLEVRAKMDGMISYVSGQEGEEARPGRWIGEIFDTSKMYMTTQVDDTEILLVKQDADVRVTVDALPGELFEGKVKQIDTYGESENGITKYQVSIEIEGNDKLKPNFQAKGYINAGSASDVMLIPLEGLLEEDGQTLVEVLQEDGTVKTVKVKIGLMNDRKVEIKEGLKIGDKAITGSSADVLPSQHIKSNDSLLPGKKDDGKSGDDTSGDDSKTTQE